MFGVIYKISNSVNDKIYIGQTIRTIEKRFKGHICSAIKNEYPDNYLHRAIRKFGPDKFKIEKIDEANSKDELNAKEKYWIKKLNSIQNGYNLTDGGEGGDTYRLRSEEQMKITRQRLSNSLKGIKNGMSIQIKCKSIKTNEEHVFESLTACLNFFDLKCKATVMLRAQRKDSFLLER